MASKALYVVGQRRFVATMRKAGADMDELKDVNAQAARVALPAVQSLVPHRTGTLAGSIRAGATKRAGVVRAGRKSVPYAGVINYGWPARHITGRLFANNGVARTEPTWAKLYEQFVKKTMSQVKGQ
ncbi:HK97 gp10 family phage protein [Bifidobacterium pseudolongum]|uniref:HK97 gp10 family phage protein n=1 Tax=Bifidobacterium pseudolongum TaxID=1694 RepID=A0A4S4F714_9BIFI|nr:HK97 gp10 family phage protein [Bifidobacterium pseudolongum]THG24934.1 HK97 gp10 family phage protein [Bifidobacterium pseudolongum]